MIIALSMALLLLPGTPVPADAISSTVESYVRAHLVPMPDSLVVEYRPPVAHPAMTDSVTAIEIARTAAPLSAGYVSLAADITINNGAVRRIYLPVRIRTFDSVMVVLRQMDRNALLLPDHVMPKMVETTQLPGDVIRKGSDLAGKRLRRVVNPGTVLLARLIEEAPQIRERSTVTLIAEGQFVRLRSEAVALQDGRIGQSILVRCPGSKKKLLATVIDRSTVRINLGE